MEVHGNPIPHEKQIAPDDQLDVGARSDFLSTPFGVNEEMNERDRLNLQPSAQRLSASQLTEQLPCILGGSSIC
jgi:hypothetical protein